MRTSTMSAVRKVLGALVWLWVCFVSQCKKLFGRSPKKTTGPVKHSCSASNASVGTSPATGQEMEWEDSWSTMEPFSVTVVPTDRDLFEDMQPVLVETKKMYIAEGREGEGDERPVGKRLKFAVESEFRGPESGELGEWVEEEIGECGGWEGETGKEEGSLVVASREAMAQQRREEREKRRALQEALRFSRQQPSALGVRLSDS